MGQGGGDARRSGEGELRISDSDRDRIASVLTRHAAEGRLTLDELDERLGVLYASQTRDQARSVVAGLPPLTGADAEEHHWFDGHGHDGAVPVLPDWLNLADLISTEAPAVPTETPRPTAGAMRDLPTDAQMAAAYSAWRAKVTKTKDNKKEHKRVQAAGDPKQTFLAFRKVAISKALCPPADAGIVEGPEFPMPAGRCRDSRARIRHGRT